MYTKLLKSREVHRLAGTGLLSIYIYIYIYMDVAVTVHTYILQRLARIDGIHICMNFSV